MQINMRKIKQEIASAQSTPVAKLLYFMARRARDWQAMADSSYYENLKYIE